MSALARILPLWALHHGCPNKHSHLPLKLHLRSAEKQMRPCSPSAEHQLPPPEQQGGDRRGPLGAACGGHGLLAANGAQQEACDVAADVAAALLKQACERIDRLRRVSAQGSLRRSNCSVVG